MTARTSSPVLPLVAKVKPIAGESLMSLVVRACEANAFERPSQLLAEAGFKGDPYSAPFTGATAVPSLARLLGVEESEVRSRMHAPPTGEIEPKLVGWFGTVLERRFLDARHRRVAPRGLQVSSHHRAAWTVGALSFCPETFQELISSCPSCSRELGWWKTQGADRCEHCKSLLTQAPSATVPKALHSALRQVTDLISPNVDRRAAVVERLPDDFRRWSAGELFSAIIEFGAGWEHPGANRRSPEAKAVARGRLGASSAQVLTSGWEVLQGWPFSLDELVARASRELEKRGDAGSLALRDLSLLGRHLDKRPPQTALRKLIRERLGEAVLRARAPLKFRIGIEDLRQTREVMTITQTAKATGISREVLTRLCPTGESFAGGRAGQGGALRFHRERILRSARAYDDALTPAAAAARLGVPEYCLPAFVKRKLIALADDADILLMKRVPFTVSAASIDALRKRMVALPPSSSSLACRLDYCLAHHFAPATWAHVFAGLARGQAGFAYVEEDSSEVPLTKSIFADYELASRRAAQTVRPRVPRGATVTAQGAALLLGLSMPPLLSLIDAGHLQAERTPQGWRIHIDRLRLFDRRWVMSPEVELRMRNFFMAQKRRFSTRGAMMSTKRGEPPSCIRSPRPDEPSSIRITNALAPTFSTPRLRIWDRKLGEQVFGLQALTAGARPQGA